MGVSVPKPFAPVVSFSRRTDFRHSRYTQAPMVFGMPHDAVLRFFGRSLESAMGMVMQDPWPALTASTVDGLEAMDRVKNKPGRQCD